MHAIALFLATISLFYNTAVSSPAPTPVPFLDPNAIQRREDPVTGACYATSKSGDVDVPTPLPSPECQVDMKTVVSFTRIPIPISSSAHPSWVFLSLTEPLRLRTELTH